VTHIKWGRSGTGAKLYFHLYVKWKVEFWVILQNWPCLLLRLIMQERREAESKVVSLAVTGQLLWFNLVDSTAIPSLTHNELGERIQKKAKLMGWDEDSLIRQKNEGKIIILSIMITQYSKKVMHNAVDHHPLTEWCPGTPWATSAPMVSSPELYCLATWIWNLPLASLDQLSWFCPLPAPYVPSASMLSWQYEKPKSLSLGVSIVQKQLKHQCVINIILIQNPKHSTMPATQKKTSSTLAETRTVIQSCITLLMHLIFYWHAMKVKDCHLHSGSKHYTNSEMGTKGSALFISTWSAFSYTIRHKSSSVTHNSSISIQSRAEC